MRDLGVKHKVANDVVLNNQGGGVLAKVMEDLHDLMRFHYFLEAMNKWVDRFQIDEEALVGVVHLNELHATVFGQTFAVDSEYWREAVVHSAHDG